MKLIKPNQMAAQSKAWVYGRSLAGIADSNPAGYVSLVIVVCCQADVGDGSITRPEESYLFVCVCVRVRARHPEWSSTITLYTYHE